MKNVCKDKIVKKTRYCSYEDREKECPLYEKAKYPNAQYCIWQTWGLECLHHKEVDNEIQK